jgi:hypothetical protein
MKYLALWPNGWNELPRYGLARPWPGNFWTEQQIVSMEIAWW